MPDQPPLDAAPEETDVANEPDTQDAVTENVQSNEDNGAVVAAGDDPKTAEAGADDRIDEPTNSDAEVAAVLFDDEFDVGDLGQTQDGETEIEATSDVSAEIDTIGDALSAQNENQSEGAEDVDPTAVPTDNDDSTEAAGDGEGDGPIVFGTGNGNNASPDDTNRVDWDDFTQLDGVESAADAGVRKSDLENGEVVSQDGDSVTLEGDSSGTVTFSDGGVLTFEGVESIQW